MFKRLTQAIRKAKNYEDERIVLDNMGYLEMFIETQSLPTECYERFFKEPNTIDQYAIHCWFNLRELDSQLNWFERLVIRNEFARHDRALHKLLSDKDRLTKYLAEEYGRSIYKMAVCLAQTADLKKDWIDRLSQAFQPLVKRLERISKAIYRYDVARKALTIKIGKDNQHFVTPEYGYDLTMLKILQIMTIGIYNDELIEQYRKTWLVFPDGENLLNTIVDPVINQVKMLSMWKKNALDTSMEQGLDKDLTARAREKYINWAIHTLHRIRTYKAIKSGYSISKEDLDWFKHEGLDLSEYYFEENPRHKSEPEDSDSV